MIGRNVSNTVRLQYGVYLSSDSSFTMNGGEIRRYAFNGVFVTGGSAVFTMNDGIISDNGNNGVNGPGKRMKFHGVSRHSDTPGIVAKNRKRCKGGFIAKVQSTHSMVSCSTATSSGERVKRSTPFSTFIVLPLTNSLNSV